MEFKKGQLTLSKGYIDNIGFISNGLKFKCKYKDLMIGVTSIIEEVEE